MNINGSQIKLQVQQQQQKKFFPEPKVSPEHHQVELSPAKGGMAKD